MLTWCHILLIVSGGVIGLYLLTELHYFLRMFACVVYARYFRRKCHVLDTTTVAGVCLTTDVDTLLYHMNNARYLRELDFARADFYERTGLYKAIVCGGGGGGTQTGGGVVQGATTIRYRRFIKPFSRYVVTSKIVYWDQKSIYMEHRFISPSDQFIRAVALCKQRVIGCDAERVIGELLARPRAELVGRPMFSVDHSNIVLDKANNKQQHPLGGGGSMTSCDVRPDVESLQQQRQQQQQQQANGDVTDAASQIQQQQQQQQAVTIGEKYKLPMPLEVSRWIECNDISSASLRNGC